MDVDLPALGQDTNRLDALDKKNRSHKEAIKIYTALTLRVRLALIAFADLSFFEWQPGSVSKKTNHFRGEYCLALEIHQPYLSRHGLARYVGRRPDIVHNISSCRFQAG
jgi:hypothetical protein